jgi:hypothetical protein
VTVPDLTPEECRAVTLRRLEVLHREFEWTLREIADVVEPWPIEWSPEGYAKPVPPKEEA